RFARVDSDAIDKLIVKEERGKLEMKEDERYDLENLFKAALPEGKDYYVVGENLGVDGAPNLITQNEFMRRYREMSALGGGMNFYGSMPESYNITVNMENPLVSRILAGKPVGDVKTDEHKAELKTYADGCDVLHQIVDLALLANGMLKGKALADFIARSEKVLLPD
ncbi:MAG: molecular chaperone HtpG, partial [Bacteroidales bacterium]|nr:molecular chaperone HtpG [Bacteroidales bacterium]